MIERLTRSPWLLGLAFLISALVGAGAFAAAQALLPGGIGSDRARVEAIVRDYLLANGEIIPEAVNLAQQREAKARPIEAAKALAANKAAVTRAFPGAEMGNPRGDVTVVAFMDYACGYCRANLPALARLVAEDPNVRIVYRELPILSEASVLAARWALAAAAQGRFRAFHEAMFASGQLSEQSIDAAIAAAGLDRAAGARMIESAAIKTEIENNYQIARALKVAGTPSWAIGDQVFYELMSYDQLKAAVADARKGK